MDRRINTAQNIYLNNVEVDNVYYNNELIWPTGSDTPWSPSSDITTALWLDASDTTSYTLSGATLNTVTDKAGNFSVTIDSTPTRVSNDLNSLNVWDFNGSESLTSFKQALYFKEIGFNLHDTMIWMLCTPVIELYPMTFAREAKKFIDSRTEPLLWNVVDKRNTVHLKLLKFCLILLMSRLLIINIH